MYNVPVGVGEVPTLDQFQGQNFIQNNQTYSVQTNVVQNFNFQNVEPSQNNLGGHQTPQYD